MASPTTTNVALPSLLDLLAVPAPLAREASAPAGFNDWLQPPPSCPPCPAPSSSPPLAAPSKAIERSAERAVSKSSGPEGAHAPQPAAAEEQPDVAATVPSEDEEPVIERATEAATEEPDPSALILALAGLPVASSPLVDPQPANAEEQLAAGQVADPEAPLAARPLRRKASPSSSTAEGPDQPVVADAPQAVAADSELPAGAFSGHSVVHELQQGEAKSELPAHADPLVAGHESAPQETASTTALTTAGTATQFAPPETERVSERSSPGDGPAAAFRPPGSVDAPPPPAPPPAPAVAAVTVAAAPAPAASTPTASTSGPAPASTPQTEAIARTTRRTGEVAAAPRGERSADVQAARLLQRVARAFAAAQQRDGEIQLRLSPPELGSLRLRVHVSDGAVTARLEVESTAAQAALTDNLPQLRERLAEQGLRIDRFEVDLMQQQAGGLPDRSQEPEPRQPQAPRPAPALRAASEPTSPPRTAGTTAGPGRLNVII